MSLEELKDANLSPECHTQALERVRLAEEMLKPQLKFPPRQPALTAFQNSFFFCQRKVLHLYCTGRYSSLKGQKLQFQTVTPSSQYDYQSTTEVNEKRDRQNHSSSGPALDYREHTTI